MMQLNENGLKNRAEWKKKGYYIPKYDRLEMVKKTRENPRWVHFGAGNIFRAFHADIANKLLDEGMSDSGITAIDRGITVVEGYDYEIIEKKYRSHDDYTILVVLKADGSVDKKIIGSIGESIILDSNRDDEFNRLKEIFKKDSLQLATFTITEKGYSVTDEKGIVLPEIKSDLDKGVTRPQSYIGKVAALLYERYEAGKKPIAMVSTDNCSHNGEKLHSAIECFALGWLENGYVDRGFCDYINNNKMVSFPWTVIDKITPRPDASVEAVLKSDGVENIESVVTSKNTYVASFVNAEETGYLVVEDSFPNGRPELEKGGVIFSDRQTVDKVEKMKVCTCLNPLHTALAIFGCILGYEKISDEMKDNELIKLIEGIGYKEGLPVVANPGVINPLEFIDTVVKVRLPNPFLPDTPQRIATDTSQKLAIRFGETIKNYQKEGLSLKNLKFIPFVFAGWLRYLMGIGDNGKILKLSPDPLLDTVRDYVKDVKLGDIVSSDSLTELLSNKSIFGVDLYEVGMADKVVSYFNYMIAGEGAVRNTLMKLVGEE